METKNREKLLLMLTGACVALWLLNLLVLSPMIDSWHSRSAEIDKLKTEIADGAGLIRRKSTIQGRWDFMRANALNSNPTVAERQLFTAFDRWVKSGGVAQGSFRPQFQESDTNYTTVDCHSDVNGGPNNVRDFVRAMSKDPLADKLDSFVLTAKDDNGQQLTLDLNMSGLVLTDSVPFVPGLADVTPPPRDTLSSTNTELDPFQLITRNNIFNQSRRYLGDNGPPIPTRRLPPAEDFYYSGPAIDYGKGGTPSATFTGSGASSSRVYNVGDTINGFKISMITLDTVKLTGASSNTFIVRVDSGLRREGDGPWQPASGIASTPTPDTISTSSVSSTSAPGAATSSILEMMKKRREQEDK